MTNPIVVSGLMLAAGQSKRFNGIKQLADVNGQAMLSHTLSNLTGNGALINSFEEFNLVLGANASLILPIVPDYVTPYIFADWQKGMGASLAYGVKHINDKSSHVFVTLGDQVAISHEQIATMLNYCKHSPEKIIAAAYEKIAGVPAIFPKEYFPELCKLDADKGARKILQQYQSEVVAIDIPNAHFDIDTQEALSYWCQTFNTKRN